MSISVLSVVFISLNMLLGLTIPITVAVIVHKKYKAKGISFLTGALIMIVFALVLEQIVHSMVLSTSFGESLKNNIWLYGLYGGLAAGVFEESGRLLAFKVLLKKYTDNKGTALMYGAGHGGLEMITILVLGMINNLIYSIMIMTGKTDLLLSKLDNVTRGVLMDAFKTLSEMNPALFVVSLVERLIAFAAQIALSVIVWYAATHRKKFGFFFVAILMHMLLDFAVAVMNLKGVNIIIIEAAAAVLAVLYVILAMKIFKKCDADETGIDERNAA